MERVAKREKERGGVNYPWVGGSVISLFVIVRGCWARAFHGSVPMGEEGKGGSVGRK